MVLSFKDACTALHAACIERHAADEDYELRVIVSPKTYYAWLGATDLMAATAYELSTRGTIGGCIVEVCRPVKTIERAVQWNIVRVLK